MKWRTLIDQLLRDVVFAVRMLRRNPLFSFAAIASLTLGIGANTAVFSLIDSLVLRPLQVRDPGQLVRIGSHENNGMTIPVPGPVLDNLRKDSLLRGVCGFTAGDVAIDFGSRSAVVPALSVTGDCYQTLGVRPAMGRLLAPSDDKFDGPKVAVLGYRFWKTELGGNPNVLGSAIKISGVPFRIIGVTEPRFEGLIWGYPASVSAPISQRTSVSAQDPSGHFYWAEILARLRSGVANASLEAELKTRWRRLLDAGLPTGFRGSSRAEILSMPPVVASGATGIDYYFREHFENALFGLLAISILVLVASCVNVANLLLARGLQRQREIGVRVAIGGARWRIIRQLLVESALILVAGLGFAFVLALMSSRLMARFLIAAFARPDIYFTVAIDWRDLLFTGVAGIFAVLIFAIVPAWRTSDVDPAASLKGASRSVIGERALARKILLSGQVAITLVVLVGASVFSYSIAYLRGGALGLTSDRVLNAQLMPASKIGSKQQNAGSYFHTLLDRIRSLPDVRNVSLTSFAPLVSAPYKEDIRRLDRPDQAVLQAPAEFVTDGFLKIMHIPLQRDVISGLPPPSIHSGPQS